MARTDIQVNIRLPADLIAALKDAAEKRGRSTNAEIVLRLESTFESVEAGLFERRMADIAKVDAARELARAEQREFMRRIDTGDFAPHGEEWVNQVLTDLHHKIIRLDRVHGELIGALNSLYGLGDSLDDK